MGDIEPQQQVSMGSRRQAAAPALLHPAMPAGASPNLRLPAQCMPSPHQRKHHDDGAEEADDAHRQAVAAGQAVGGRGGL